MTWSHDLFLTLITLLPLVFGSVLDETETEKKRTEIPVRFAFKTEPKPTSRTTVRFGFNRTDRNTSCLY